METPIFKIDMKFYRQDGNVKFFDADFANVFKLKSDDFTNKTFWECLNIVNTCLHSSGYNGKDLFQIGRLKSKQDFDLGNFVIWKNSSIALRLHNFENAFEVFKILKEVKAGPKNWFQV